MNSQDSEVSEVGAWGLSGPGPCSMTGQEVNRIPVLQQLLAWKEGVGNGTKKKKNPKVFFSECAWSLQEEVLTHSEKSVFARGGKVFQLEGTTYAKA